MSLYTELEAKQTELQALQDQLSDLQSKLSDIEKNPQEYADLENEYDEMLDDVYSEVCDALPVSMTGSQLIAEHDPVMYRCGYSDFCNAYDYSSLEVYTDTENEIEEVEDQISDIETEISEIEDQIEALEAEEE